MQPQTSPSFERSDKRYTWDIDSVFPDKTSWEREVEAVGQEGMRLESLRGMLAASPQGLYQALRTIDSLNERLSRVGLYASMRHAADTRDDEASGMKQRVSILSARVSSSLAFVEPEILLIGWQGVEQMFALHQPLETYRFYLSELERRRPHTLSESEEALISSLSPLGSLPEAVRDAAHDGDMTFAPVLVAGKDVEPTHGTMDEFFQHTDRSVRQAGYNSYTDSYLARRKTLAATLTSHAATSQLFCRARKFSSTFEAALFTHSLGADVYNAAMESCREHQDLFQRYFKAKARALGVQKLAESDIFAKLSASSPEILYDRGVEMVLDALAPLGEEYVSIARRGMLEERWVHVFPAPGKYSNAFSSGTFGTRPFFFLNYTPTMPEVGTLAHELGHSMHSFFTHRTQPSRYSSCSMTVAETASNLNQVLLRGHLLKNADREMALAVLDEAFYFAHRYLYMMPVLSEVEYKLHSTYAHGETLGASEICRSTVDAFSRAYGDAVEFDPERLGMKWAQFCHFYVPFYLFQYSVGISAAMSIGKRLIANEPGMRERYLRFLSSGGSMSPRDVFAIVGVDIASKETYREAFSVVTQYVETLEKLV